MLYVQTKEMKWQLNFFDQTFGGDGLYKRVCTVYVHCLAKPTNPTFHIFTKKVDSFGKLCKMKWILACLSTFDFYFKHSFIEMENLWN